MATAADTAALLVVRGVDVVLAGDLLTVRVSLFAVGFAGLYGLWLTIINLDTTLTLALLLGLEAVSVAACSSVRERLTCRRVAVEEELQFARLTVTVIPRSIANILRLGLGFTLWLWLSPISLAMTLRHALALLLKVVAVAQAVSVLERFAASCAGLVVPTVNLIVARTLENGHGASILNPLALVVTLLSGFEVVGIATLAMVQELCANSVMTAVVISTNLLITLTSICVHVAAVGIKLIPSEARWSLRLLRLTLLLLVFTFGLAVLLLRKVVAVSITTSVVELATAGLGRVPVPTGNVILTRSQVSREFASVFDFLGGTTSLALVLGAVVVGVALTASVIEGHAFVIRLREHPSSQLLSTFTLSLGLRAFLVVDSGFLATVLAGSLRLKVVLVALASTITEWTALLGLLIKGPPLKVTIARSLLDRLRADWQ